MRIKVKKPIYQAFIAFLGILSVASALAGTSILFVHSDHLGTPQAMTDANQIVVWRANYTPFGEAEVDEDPDGDGVAVEMPLRFPGQYFDKETGLHYNYYRDYDPTLGRYIQADPIGITGSLVSPQRFIASEMGVPIRFPYGTINNLYSYVGQNPLSMADPTGEGPLVYVFVAAVCGFAIYAAVETAEDGMQRLVGIQKEKIDAAGGSM